MYVLQVLEVAVNETVLTTKCSDGSLAGYLADGSSDTTVASTMQTVLCSVTTELPQAFREFIDYEAIGSQVLGLFLF